MYPNIINLGFPCFLSLSLSIYSSFKFKVLSVKKSDIRKRKNKQQKLKKLNLITTLNNQILTFSNFFASLKKIEMMNSDLVHINLMFLLLCLVGSLWGDVTSLGDEWMTSFASSFIRPTSLEYDPNTGEVQFESIRKRLRLRPDEVDFMTRKFDLRALELVYPTSLKEIERQGWNNNI